MYKVMLEGLERIHDTLLPAMQQRKHILALCPQASILLTVWEYDGNKWVLFDADKFLSGLKRMLEPADDADGWDCC